MYLLSHKGYFWVSMLNIFGVYPLSMVGFIIVGWFNMDSNFYMPSMCFSFVRLIGFHAQFLKLKCSMDGTKLARSREAFCKKPHEKVNAFVVGEWVGG